MGPYREEESTVGFLDQYFPPAGGFPGGGPHRLEQEVLPAGAGEWRGVEGGEAHVQGGQTIRKKREILAGKSSIEKKAKPLHL